MVYFHTHSVSVELKNLGDHLQQGGPSMAAKIAIDGQGTPLTMGGQLQCDRPLKIFLLCIVIN